MSRGRLESSFTVAIVVVVVAGLLVTPSLADFKRTVPFQMSVVLRPETEFFNADFTRDILEGKIESLQALRPGQITGDFRTELNLETLIFSPPNLPPGLSALVETETTIVTKLGSISFEVTIENVLVDLEGGLATSGSIVYGRGEITGGTKRFKRVTGEATLTGRIRFCDMSVDEHCIPSEMVPPDSPATAGIQFDLNVILRGEKQGSLKLLTTEEGL